MASEGWQTIVAGIEMVCMQKTVTEFELKERQTYSSDVIFVSQGCVTVVLLSLLPIYLLSTSK